MKRYLLSFFILLNSLAYSFIPATTSRVWVCVGGSAYAYHAKQDCSVLKHCTHVTRKTSLDSAVQVYKRKPCKQCY